MITAGCAALGFGDQQWQMGLEATGESVVEGGVQVIQGWIRLIGRQVGWAGSAAACQPGNPQQSLEAIM